MKMAKVIYAVFENGVFRPIEKINLPDNQEVEIIIQDDIPTRLIAVSVSLLTFFQIVFIIN